MSRIEDQVCKKIMKRAEFGFKKYGKTMERDDFSIIDWLSYLQEELMDSVVYLERLIEDMRVEKTGAVPSAFRKTKDGKFVDMFEVRPGHYMDKKSILDGLKQMQKDEETNG